MERFLQIKTVIGAATLHPFKCATHTLIFILLSFIVFKFGFDSADDCRNYYSAAREGVAAVFGHF